MRQRPSATSLASRLLGVALRFHLLQRLLRGIERDRPSALTAVYTVRSTMPTLGTHVGAKLQRAIARVRCHGFDDHRPWTHGTEGVRHSGQPLFRRHVMPFRRKRSRAIDSRERQLSFDESTVNFQSGRHLEPPLARAHSSILSRPFCLRRTRQPRLRHPTAQ